MRTFYIIAILFFSQITLAQYATHLVVDQKGMGDYLTLQAAIDDTKAFSEKDITIEVKNGVYKEKVRVYSWNTRLTIKGESRDSTIITWDDYFKKINKGRNSTFHTYTLKVESNDVTLENLTINNAAGPVGQAVALHVEGDRTRIKNCSINGNQDTFYADGEGVRVYVANSIVTGTTDFIFGGATVVFDQCDIISKSNSYITAASTPEAVPFGFVFINCDLKASEGVNEVYLGRPWRSYASTIFINCWMGAHITPEGWDPWGSEAKKSTVRYSEYGSEGPGGDTSERVEWSHILKQPIEINHILSGWNPMDY